MTKRTEQIAPAQAFGAEGHNLTNQMAESVSLRRFLQTGEFERIKFGLDRTGVTEMLGEPDAVGGTSQKYREPDAGPGY
jgi:hypothetical protein